MSAAEAPETPPRREVPPAQTPAGAPAENEGPPIAPVVRAGAVIVIGFFGVFGGWAALAPLESAAIAPGIVSVDTNRKTIQHLEGGIIGEILVRDGDVVRKGQPLVALDATRAEATLDLLRGRHLAALALEARLVAERDGAARITFPQDLLTARGQPQVDEAIAGQMKIFSTRRETVERQVAVLQQRSRQSREEIRGLSGQIAAEDRQLDLLAGEIRDVEWLVQQGLARKPRLLALQRQQAEVQGSRARNVASIARAEQAITEAELRVAELRTTQLNEVAQSLRQAQTDLFDLNEQRRAAQDVLRRIVIRAPQDGTVVGLQVHTSGGVIAPGGVVMDVVPLDDRMIVDARVDPTDIDIVRPGLKAQVRLSAYAQRNFVPLEGEVLSVSADRLVDEKTGVAYFRARVGIIDDPVRVMRETPLYPGMQAEVLIVTGKRTLLDYMVRPLADSLNRAFREN